MAWLIFKINLMVVGLVVIIYTSHALSTRGLPSSLGSFLGMGPSTNAILNVSWCDTRVTSIEFEPGQKIFQEGYKWYSQTAGQSPTELNFLAVEKWFAEYCKVKAKNASDVPASGIAAVIEFIDGRREMIKTAGNGLFRWRDRSFESTELEQGLEAGRNLR